MARKLTTLAVEAAKPRHGKRTEYPDAGCPGLFLVVQPSHVKSWALRFRFNGKSRKLTIGPANELTLAAARAAAAAHHVEIEQGIDPAAAKQTARATSREQAAHRASDTIEVMIERFLAEYARRKTREITWRSYERVLRRHVIPRWPGRTIHEIRRRDIIDLIEGIAEATPYMANRLRAVLSKFFSWLVARDVIKFSPVAGVERPGVEAARDRVLDDAEVTQLWAAGADLGRAGDYFKLLLLTGGRRSEIGQARWDEIDAEGRTLTIPASRSKNRRPHIIPLVDAAWEILDRQPRIGAYVFPSRVGSGPLSAFHHLKEQIDGAASLAKPWRWHDTRRTVASGLQKLGVRIEVIEQVLGHTSGVFRGVVGTYQRHDYSEERRDALERWAGHLDRLVTGRAGAVVPQRGGRR
jgi:integrase